MIEIANMSFAEFAKNIKATCAANKFPSMGLGGEDVYSYSVYLNGPLADRLPEAVKVQHVKDIWLTAKTAEAGLNPELFRDNARVLELVAEREAYMAAILEINKDPDISLSEQTSEDYRMLTSKKLVHPFLIQQIEEQKLISKGLKPAIEAASAITGKEVIDRAPREISKGVVVYQSTEFTFQELKGTGEIAVHENRRLDAIPANGTDVTISYYRGQGQVFTNHELVSAPYIDPKTQDLAVSISDAAGRPTKVVLFNSISSYAKFVGEHDLDDKLIEAAMDLHQQRKKKETLVEPVVRGPVSEVYVDKTSGCLAVDYSENNMAYSAIFGNADGIAKQAKEFGLNADHVAKAKSLEVKYVVVTPEVIDASIVQLVGQLKQTGISNMADPARDGQTLCGKVVAESTLHIAQETGRGTVQVFDKRNLDKLPNVGDTFTVKMAGEQGKVSSLVRDPNRSIGR